MEFDAVNMCHLPGDFLEAKLEKKIRKKMWPLSLREGGRATKKITFFAASLTQSGM